MGSLDKLVAVDVRKHWPHETDFSKWLSESDNLQSLGDEIGMDLALIGTEVAVGSFSVDILARDKGNDHKVVIENQFATTNHDHLGKIITYGAGHEAQTIVWIFESIREEHRRALDWLNEHTGEGVSLFGVELELWKIGSSDPAPRFNVVSRPNDWAKVVRRQATAEELSDGQQDQLAFWTGLKEYAAEHHPGMRLQTPRPQHWFDVSIGTSRAHVALTMNRPEQRLACELYIPDDKELYAALLKGKASIEEKVGVKMEWRDLRKACRIIQATQGFDIGNQAEQVTHYKWLLERATLFKQTFSDLIQEFEANGPSA